MKEKSSEKLRMHSGSAAKMRNQNTGAGPALPGPGKELNMSMEKKDDAVQAADKEIQQRDEELFDSLRRSKKQRRKKRIRRIAIVVGVLAAVLIAAVLILRRQVRVNFARDEGEVLSATVERGTISTVVSGSGMLENVDTETVTLPEGVELTEILAQFGDSYQEGELLATADMSSVRSAMSTLQSEIDQLDDEISQAEGDTVSSYISAGVSGRVKAIYAEVGSGVADAMVDKGALALISLDGYMAVDIETNALEEGDMVTVLLSDGSEEAGLVDSLVGNIATVLISDDGPAVDETVTVTDAEGRELGSGSLYVHSPLKVTGYAGTVSGVYVAENQAVSASSTLFVLTDTSTSASYDALLQSRSEAEEELLELLKIQQYGGLTAPISGTVYSVTELEDLESGETDEVLTLAPDVSVSVTISVDEDDILSLALDQTAEVTVSSLGDDVLSGTVTEIDKTASDGSYTAVITLDKVEGMLPGMTAGVDIRIEGVDDALLIPVEALHQTSSGYYVYTSYDEDSGEYGGRVDVVPGLSNSSYVEIKSGLSEGDTVYYTESQIFFSAMVFGGMSGSQRGSFTGGEMPSGGMSGGERPTGDFGGGEAQTGGMGGGMPGRS